MTFSYFKRQEDSQDNESESENHTSRDTTTDAEQRNSEAESQHNKDDEEEEKPRSRPGSPIKAPPRSPVKQNPPVYQEEKEMASTISTEDLPRHYRFGVELKTVKDFVFGVAHLYFKYSYPPFGSDLPVYTRPPIMVQLPYNASGAKQDSKDMHT
jgi:hypothetical protein